MVTTQAELLASESHTSACPLCEGHGEVYAGVSYGYFDIHQEQYYPVPRREGYAHSHPYPCPTCEGKGELAETCCSVCEESVEVCWCSDTEVDAYLLDMYLGAASHPERSSMNDRTQQLEKIQDALEERGYKHATTYKQMVLTARPSLSGRIQHWTGPKGNRLVQVSLEQGVVVGVEVYTPLVGSNNLEETLKVL